jgi:iron complex transport system ATP-binding protein
LTIREREHTAILGPNGAGKTSLINLLTHQDRALAGDGEVPPVEVFGDARWNIFDLRTRIGIVSQDLHQRFVGGNSEGYIRGEEAVLSGFFGTYGIVRTGEVTEAMRRRAAEALTLIGAVHLGRKLFNEMSTGEARRVLIARALVTAPRALVLDEPTAGLDVIARRRFLEQVRAIARTGTTVILVTHHVEDIIPEVDHVVLLKHGRVTLTGDKETVLNPANLSALFDAPVALEKVGGLYFAKG